MVLVNVWKQIEILVILLKVPLLMVTIGWAL
jgi:hypothetical protein